MAQESKVENLKKDFLKLISAESGEKVILDKLSSFELDKHYLDRWYQFSKLQENVYPSQGLVTTPYDYLSYNSLQLLPQETIIETLRVRRFFLEVFNHPYRIHFLDIVNSNEFEPPGEIRIKVIDESIKNGLSLSIGDFAASVTGASNERVSRRERYAQGPFVKLGKQARAIFMGSSSPDVWNSAASIASMAASHCLAAIPRNGLLKDIKRQTDLAKEIFNWLKEMEHEILSERKDKAKISKYWRRNVTGTLEASPEKGVKRAESLYKQGVRTFRVYSPEPATGVVETVKALRKQFKNYIEIIASFIVDTDQAKKCEEAGANSIIVGVGGGGRCITGVRSGTAIDWPQLVYLLRGGINIPIIVEGGASDHIALTLLLGASGISVSRIASGGTIESPGGALFYSNNRGKLFKPYGGEASPRTKFLEGKLLPFDIPSFVEGETDKAFLNYGEHKYPTLTYNIHMLTEDAILALVFRGVKNIHELHNLEPSPIGRITASGEFQRNTH